MEREQAHAGHLLARAQVVQVGAGVARARRARAALDERPLVLGHRRASQVERKARAGLGRERHPVARETRRDRAVEERRCRGRSPRRGRRARRCRAGGAAPRREAAAASRRAPRTSQASRAPASRRSRSRRRRRPTRLGGLVAQVLVDPALDDPEHGLALGAVLAVPLEAAVQPAVRALGRARRVLAVGVIRRALVERQRDVRAERGLDLHRVLGREHVLGSVDVGAKAHPLLGDLEHVPLAGRRPRRPLISSATAPWASEKTWKPPESVMIARSHPMKRCRPPSFAIRSGPGDSNRW